METNLFENKPTWRAILVVEPAGKGRPRTDFVRKRNYTPQKTVAKEEEIRYWLLQKEAPKFEGPVEMTLTFYLRRPKSLPKRRKSYATKRPDLDNYLKLFCDAANGILYDDDSQIVKATIMKKYTDKGDLPSISCEVKNYE